jgi:stage II sporulation protein D
LLTVMASLFIVLAIASASEAAEPGLVRVQLTEQAGSCGFTVKGNYKLVDQATGEIIAKLKPGENWLVNLQDGRIAIARQGGRSSVYKGPVSVQASGYQVSVLSGNGKLVDTADAEDLAVINGAGEVALLSESTANIALKGSQRMEAVEDSAGHNLLSLITGNGTTRYRGNFEFQVAGDKLMVLNILHIEDYLCGVVPCECIPSWPEEALKAQAVAARNYALQTMETSRGKGNSFDLVASQYNQVYGGYDAETEATNKAVKDTAGIVMTSGGNLITAFFHCSSGGVTENSEDVWSSPLPYIKGKPDTYDKNELHYNWQVTYTSEDLVSLINKAGYPMLQVTDIAIKEMTSSGERVKSLIITGLNTAEKPERIEISNADWVRSVLGLKSSLFVLNKSFDKDKNLTSVKITGKGYGHGVGMSQYGAYGMASKGYNYQDILKYYYTGVTLQEHYGRSARER